VREKKAAGIVGRLLSNAEGLKYGSVSVTVKVHDSRIVEVIFSTTESAREREVENNAKNAKEEE